MYHTITNFKFFIAWINYNFTAIYISIMVISLTKHPDDIHTYTYLQTYNYYIHTYIYTYAISYIYTYVHTFTHITYIILSFKYIKQMDGYKELHTVEHNCFNHIMDTKKSVHVHNILITNTRICKIDFVEVVGICDTYIYQYDNISLC